MKRLISIITLVTLALLTSNSYIHAQEVANPSIGSPTSGATVVQGRMYVKDYFYMAKRGNLAAFTSTKYRGGILVSIDDSTDLPRTLPYYWDGVEWKAISLGAVAGAGPVDTVYVTSGPKTDTLWQIKDGDVIMVHIFDRNCGYVDGSVLHDSLLAYTVANVIIIDCTNGQRYSFPTANITLTAADNDSSRYDIIYANSTGIHVQVGTLDPNPVIPLVAPGDVILAVIPVPAGATSPTSMEDFTIYDEHLGIPSEAEPSGTSITIDEDNFISPHHLVKAISTGAVTSASTITFDFGSDKNIHDFSTLSFWIKLKSAFAQGTQLQLYWLENNQKQSTTINLANGLYGYNRNSLAYQQIIIPLSDFAFTQSNIDAFAIQMSGSNANGLYIDWVRMQGGIVFPAAIDTAGKWINTIYRVPGKDSIFYVKGTQVFAIKDSTGGATQRFGVEDNVATEDRAFDWSGQNFMLGQSGATSNYWKYDFGNNQIESYFDNGTSLYSTSKHSLITGFTKHFWEVGDYGDVYGSAQLAASTGGFEGTSFNGELYSTLSTTTFSFGAGEMGEASDVSVIDFSTEHSTTQFTRSHLGSAITGTFTNPGIYLQTKSSTGGTFKGIYIGLNSDLQFENYPSSRADGTTQKTLYVDGSGNVKYGYLDTTFYATQYDLTSFSSGGIDSVTLVPAPGMDTLVNWAGGVGTEQGFIDRNCGMIKQGIVIWDSLYEFTVSPSIYRSCATGLRYTTALTQITLSPPDDDSTRIDVIVLEDGGNVTVLEGALTDGTAVKPQLTNSQIELFTVFVPYYATPSAFGVDTILVYNENNGWTVSGTNVTVDPDNTTAPHVGAKDIDVGAVTSSSKITIAASGNYQRLTWEALRFHIKLKSTLAQDAHIQVWFNTGNGTTSSKVEIQDGSYGFNRTNTSTYQTIIIPLTDFYFVNNLFSSLVFEMTGSNANGFYLDYITIIDLQKTNTVVSPLPPYKNGIDDVLGLRQEISQDHQTIWNTYAWYNSGNFVSSSSSPSGMINLASSSGYKALSITSGGTLVGDANEPPLFILKGGTATDQIVRGLDITNTTGLAKGIELAMKSRTSTTVYGDATIQSRWRTEWTVKTHATRTSKGIFTAVNSGTEQDVITYSGNGNFRLNKYGINTFAGTPAYAIGVDASGNFVEFTPGGGGISSLTSVGGGLDIQQGGAGNIRTLNTGEFDVATNLISLKTGGIANSKLTNSTISGISLGSNLADLTFGYGTTLNSGTTYNGGTAKTVVVDTTIIKDHLAATLTVAASNISAGTKNWDYVADGTADDVTIQTAISALPAAGGTILLSHGQFNFSDSVVIPSNVTIKGQGKSTIIKGDGVSSTTTLFWSSATTGVEITDMTLDGASKVTKYGVFFKNVGTGFGSSVSPGFVLKNLWIKDIYQSGIDVRSGTNGTIYNINSIGVEWDAIVLRKDAGGSVGSKGITISNTVSSGSTAGIWLIDVQECIVDGNYVEGDYSNTHNQIGIQIDQSKKIVISNNISKKNSENNFFISQSEDIVFTGNISDSTELFMGVSVGDSRRVNITGNIIKNSAQEGMVIASSNNKVDGNFFWMNGTETNDTYNHLEIWDDSCTISNNTFRKGPYSAGINRAKYALRFTSGAARNIITGNDFDSSGVTGDILYAGSAANNNYQRNNLSNAGIWMTTDTRTFDIGGDLKIATVTNDDTEDKLLVWNSTDKIIEYRTVASLPGGGGAIGGSIASTQVAFGSGTNTITGSSDFTFASNQLRVNNQVVINTSAVDANVNLQVAGTGYPSGADYQIIADNTDDYSTTPGSGIMFRNKYNAAGALTPMGGVTAIKENATDGEFGSRLIFWSRTDGSSALSTGFELNSDQEVLFGGAVANDFGDYEIQIKPKTTTEGNLLLKGISSQTSEYLTVENSGGTKLAAITSNGELIFDGIADAGNYDIQVSKGIYVYDVDNGSYGLEMRNSSGTGLVLGVYNNGGNTNLSAGSALNINGGGGIYFLAASQQRLSITNGSGVSITPLDAPVYIDVASTTGNAVFYSFDVKYDIYSGSYGTGIGTGIKFRTGTGASNVETGALFDIVSTDITAASEDFDFVVKLMAGGSAAAEKLRVLSTGELKVQLLNQDDAETKVVVWNSTDKIFEWRDASTLTGGGALNLSYDAANREVDISGGGTSAVIPLATTGTTGLVSATTQAFTGTKVFNDYSQQEVAIQFKENAIGSSAASGYAWIYVKSDGLFYGRDDANVETKLSNDAGGSATFAGLTDVNLTSITTNDFLKWDGTDWVNRSPSQVISDLSLVVGTNVQAWDTDLDTWAGITPGTNVGTFLATPSSANLRSALTDENGTGVALFNGATSPDFTTGVTIGSVAVPTISSTNTLTNKRITVRSGTTTSSATPTINTDNVDLYTITAQTVDITSMTTNLSGTPVEGDEIEIWITGTASRAITWGASFAAGLIALPTTTSGTSQLRTRFVRTGSVWTIKGVY